MLKPVRNRSYVRVSYGVFNLVASQQAAFSDNGHTAYGDGNLNDDILPDRDYATFEKNYWRADGKQLLLPAAAPYNYDGFVSSAVSGSDSTFTADPTITVSFSDAQDIFGLTFTFPEGQVPQEIKVNGTAYYPDDSFYVISDKLEAVTEINIEFVKAPAPGRRVRLNRLQFGQTVYFENKQLIKTSFSSSIDFLSLSLTQKQFSFTIDNRRQIYNPLNPSGLYAYLAAKQPVEVDYGYELDDGSIEWILGDNLVLESTPTISDNQAQFPAVDNLTNLTGMFPKGLYRPSGISLYDLAKEVLDDAGVEHYVIDEHLKSVYTKAALPVATHRECLQIIANAGQCILYTDRNGYIKLEVALDPTITIGDNGHTIFSNSDSAYNDEDLPTEKYADFLPNSWKAAGKKVLLPSVGPYIRTGFVSDKICGDDGTFSEYPVFYWKYSFPYSAFQIPITFDNVDGEYATDFDVVYKLDGEEIDRVSVTGNTAVTYNVEHDISGIDEIDIEIHKWSVSTRRAMIAQIGKGRVNDMRIDFNTASAKPVVEKSSQVKTVTVNCYSYTPAAAATEMYHENITPSGTVTLNITHDAATEIFASVTGIKDDNGNVADTDVTITAQEHYTYYSIVTLTGAKPATLSLTGRVLTTASAAVVKQLNPQGEDKAALQNPLITDLTNAQNTAVWIADYFSKRNILTTDYRGNPEIDAHDLAYMESQFEGLFPARVMEHKIEFDGALSGYVKAVKMN
jgi:hypothetical protein